jgi:hypothetical protein
MTNYIKSPCEFLYLKNVQLLIRVYFIFECCILLRLSLLILLGTVDRN